MPELVRDRAPRVGILGAGWGRTHVGTFRAAGCEVVAIVASSSERSREVAEAEGVPGWSLDDLATADVVVVAAPATSHLDLVAAHRDKHVLCEKPFAGRAAGEGRARELARGSVWVNYALPFLETARHAARLVREGRVGAVERVRVEARTRIPGRAPTRAEQMDVAVHALPFARAVAASARVDVDLAPLDRPGITLDVLVTGARGTLAFGGSWEPERTWRWGPCRLPQAVTEIEARTDGDVWYDANCRAVAAFVDVVRGARTPDEAREAGLVDASTAVDLERPFAHLF